MSAWTDKHDAYCLEHRIAPSAKLLWQWLLSRSEALEQEPDLAEFNDWIGKHRGETYHRDTLKRALAQLINCKIVTPLKRFSWRIWRFVLRPIALITTPPMPRKNSHNRDEMRDPQPSNPQSAVREDLAAAASDSEILETCEQVGIPFRPSEAGNLLKNSINDVLLAIAHFWCRGGHEKIENPQGWLIECLRRRWWEDAADYYSAHSPIAIRQALEWESAGHPLEINKEVD